jgi:fluoroacetyl-CoA thioesterase
MSELAVGLRGTATRTVTEDLLASSLGSGAVPVFATPALLAMIEDAAASSVAPLLDEGAVTVGVWVELEHIAASKPGAHVRATAELTDVDGRTLEFRCEAYDGDVLIGRARHRRAVVDRERFLSRL